MIRFPEIDPVAVQVGPLAVRWYGLMYLVSFTLAWLILRSRCKKGRLELDQTQLMDLITWSALGIILGARLGYVLFYDFPSYMADPLKIFAVWEGGMSFHGGLIGLVTAGWLFSRRVRPGFLTLADAGALVAPVGLFFGRIGNFINGELYGRVAEVPWAVFFPGQTLPRHPSQLYEALLEGPILFLIVWAVDKKAPWQGMVLGTFLAGYGVFRFIVEFFREPDSHIGYMLGVFTRGQLLSLPVVLAGVAIIAVALKHRREHGV